MGGRVHFRTIRTFDIWNFFFFWLVFFFLIKLRIFSSFQPNTEPVWDYSSLHPNLLMNSAIVIILSGSQPFCKVLRCIGAAWLGIVTSFGLFPWREKLMRWWERTCIREAKWEDFALVNLHYSWRSWGREAAGFVQGVWWGKASWKHTTAQGVCFGERLLTDMHCRYCQAVWRAKTVHLVSSWSHLPAGMASPQGQGPVFSIYWALLWQWGDLQKALLPSPSEPWGLCSLPRDLL